MVTTEILVDTHRKTIVKIIGDGAQSVITLFDVSALVGAGVDPRLSIAAMQWSIEAGTVELAFDATVNYDTFFCSGNGGYNVSQNWTSIPVYENPDEPAGMTGDVVFTKNGTGKYTLIIEVHKLTGWTETDIQ
jgi:hypothetical protein